MQRIFITLLALPFLIGCSEKPEHIGISNSCTDEQLAELLKEHENLKTLHLEACSEITDAGLEPLKRFKKLEGLTL